MGTPGRLLEHLQNPPPLQTDLRQRVQDIKILVLDDLDSLLKLGFRPSLESLDDSPFATLHFFLYAWTKDTAPPPAANSRSAATTQWHLSADQRCCDEIGEHSINRPCDIQRCHT